jgi:hypothetical protein
MIEFIGYTIAAALVGYVGYKFYQKYKAAKE